MILIFFGIQTIILSILIIQNLNKSKIKKISSIFSEIIIDFTKTNQIKENKKNIKKSKTLNFKNDIIRNDSIIVLEENKELKKKDTNFIKNEKKKNLIKNSPLSIITLFLFIITKFTNNLSFLFAKFFEKLLFLKNQIFFTNLQNKNENSFSFRFSNDAGFSADKIDKRNFEISRLLKKNKFVEYRKIIKIKKILKKKIKRLDIAIAQKRRFSKLFTIFEK